VIAVTLADLAGIPHGAGVASGRDKLPVCWARCAPARWTCWSAIVPWPARCWLASGASCARSGPPASPGPWRPRLQYEPLTVRRAQVSTLSMLFAFHQRSALRPICTGPGTRVAAATRGRAGRACSPTSDPTVTTRRIDQPPGSARTSVLRRCADSLTNVTNWIRSAPRPIPGRPDAKTPHAARARQRPNARSRALDRLPRTARLGGPSRFDRCFGDSRSTALCGAPHSTIWSGFDQTSRLLGFS